MLDGKKARKRGNRARMRPRVRDEDALQGRIKQASAALGAVVDLNRMLAMPAKFHEIVKGQRRPIQEHFGRALFPIVPEFDTNLGSVSIQRLAKALIDGAEVSANLRHFYKFAPVKSPLAWLVPLDRTEHDPQVVHETLIRFMLYDYACVENYGMPYKRLLVDVGNRKSGALFNLVRVDKTFLVGPHGASLIILKQHEGDWAFFEKLGEAIKQKPLDEPAYLFKAKLICAYLWDSELVGVSFPAMVEALGEAGVLARGADPRSFAKTLNRQGLKRTQYNRK